MDKNSNYARGEADFLTGYLSERVMWNGSDKCTADFFGLQGGSIGQKRT